MPGSEQLLLFAGNRSYIVPAVSFSKTYLSVRHVAERLDVSPNTIWRWTANNAEFPKPIKLGPGCTRWLLAELETYEVSREASR